MATKAEPLSIEVLLKKQREEKEAASKVSTSDRRTILNLTSKFFSPSS